MRRRLHPVRAALVRICHGLGLLPILSHPPAMLRSPGGLGTLGAALLLDRPTVDPCVRATYLTLLLAALRRRIGGMLLR